MVSNAYTPGLSTAPASTSTAVIQDLLRQELHFSGLVLTDSLSAGAISAAGYTVPQAAVAAVTAGADLVLFGSTLTPADTARLNPNHVAEDRQAIIDALVDAADTGSLPASRIDEAVAHVLRAKGSRVCGT
jgi:beta-N-acetylhexosaminidase